MPPAYQYAMQSDVPQRIRQEVSVEFRLLGQVPFDDCLTLQKRLAEEAGTATGAKMVVLLCEHPRLITVGRTGSRGHIRLSSEQLRREQLDLKWVGRGGGCVLHSPGQLAVYVIAPLERLGWSVGDYLRRLQRALVEGLTSLGIRGREHPRQFGVWGRSGLLATVGVAVRDGVALHGVHVNVNPSMRLYAFVDVLDHSAVAPMERSTMGCLLAEKRSGVRMSAVRSALVESVASVFHSPEYHILTGHPWLTTSANPAQGTSPCNV